MVIVLLILALLWNDSEDHQFAAVFKELSLPNGLILDRTSDKTTVSCASTGLVSYSKAILAQRDVLDRTEVLDNIKAGFEATLAKNPAKNRGWLYHFTDEHGIPKSYSEVSTVDTAIFYLSYLRAATILEDQKFLAQVTKAINEIDLGFMMKGSYFMHGCFWSDGQLVYIEELWDDYNEGVMIYRLFNKPFKAVIANAIDLPLFVYYYPLCFFDDAHYVAMLQKAVDFQEVAYGHIGVTACDGPDGYQVNEADIVSPLSVYAASIYSRKAADYLSKMTHSRLLPSFSATTKWECVDKLGIDFGSCYIVTRKNQPIR